MIILVLDDAITAAIPRGGGRKQLVERGRRASRRASSE